MIYTLWSDLGQLLEGTNYEKYYFTAEKYKADNPLENLVVLPGIESFFGPKVLNLFIVSKPYGWKKNGDGEWEENWPPEGLNDAVARHQASFEAFRYYKTYIFIDFNFARKLKERVPDSRIEEMLTATKNRLATLVSEQLGEYGFEMGPDIQNEVGAEFFAPYLDLHFTGTWT